MTINHADCFVALARAGDPGRAAALCGTSRSVLLRAVLRLETELEGLLFTRRPGPLRLSPLGEAWLPLLADVAHFGNAAMPCGHRGDAAQASAAPGPLAA